MYATVEAVVKNGRVLPLEPGRIPKNGRVLLTILPDARNQTTWSQVRKHLGWFKGNVDSVSWQRRVRSEWDSRA
jgi:hypothetical protein